MITLPDLPYERSALAPHISSGTIGFHYDRHHKSYVDKTNELIEGGKLANATLEDVVRESEGRDQHLFNNAAQAWNHDFYWRSMAPGGGGEPKGDIAALIEKSFGGHQLFAKKIADAGTGQFGSGWVWLVRRGAGLEIVKTSNAETPLTGDMAPLLTMDVWEHAYYLDYQNARAKYVAAFLDHLINWEFANENLAR